MADDFPLWVAVVGLPSAKSEHSIGPGKSCLCNRFLRPKEDDYGVNHPSAISNQDFVGSVVNTDNFLYWGKVRKSENNLAFLFQIIEQTQFYDDVTLKPFGCSDAYEKRAVKTTITTQGSKSQYVNYEQLAEPDLFPETETFPKEKVSIDAFIIAFDVSNDDIDFVKQFNLLELFLKKISKPIVLALTKYDVMNEKCIKTIREWSARKKINVIEVSSEENINVDSVFLTLGKLVKCGGKSKHNPNKSQNNKIMTFEECQEDRKGRYLEIGRMYNTCLTETVKDYKSKWRDFQMSNSSNVNFVAFCDVFGSQKAKQKFSRHIRELLSNMIEVRKNNYLKDLDQVFKHFITDLSHSVHEDALQLIRNHSDFNTYFVALSDECSWRSDNEVMYSEDKVMLIPFDLLKEPEAVKCFEQRVEELEAIREQEVLADEFEQILSHTPGIIAGLSFEKGLSELDDKFTKLDRGISLTLYDGHQVALTKKSKEEFLEMLVEEVGVFRSLMPSGVLRSDAKQLLDDHLKEDIRWRDMSELVAERDVMILRHISIIVTGIRPVGEPRLMEENFRNIILEKPLERVELSSIVDARLTDQCCVNVVLMSVNDSAQQWADKINALGTLANGDEVYKVNAVARDPRAMDLPKDLPIHAFMGFYYNEDWESFRAVTIAFDRLLGVNKGGAQYRGVPCHLVYTSGDSVNPTVTEEEGKRFARRLNCELLADTILKEQLSELLLTSCTLISQRLEFLATPLTSMSRNIINIGLRVLSDDEICLREIASALFRFQYCFNHPYEQGVFVVHTLVCGTPYFVMVQAMHYLEKENCNLHGSVLVCKDSRKASINNAKSYIDENHTSQGLGVLCQHSKSCSADVWSFTNALGIKVSYLEPETTSRRSSVGSNSKIVDDLFHDVIERSVQHVTLTDSTRHTSHGDESDASYDDGDDEGKKYAHYTEQEKEHIQNRIEQLKNIIKRKSKYELPFHSPNYPDPGRGVLSPEPQSSIPDDVKVSLKMKQLSLSLSELREEDHSTQRYNSLPRMQHSSFSSSSPSSAHEVIYATVTPADKRRSSAPHPPQGDTPPPLPPLPLEYFSETSSEGIDLVEDSRVTNSTLNTTLNTSTVSSTTPSNKSQYSESPFKSRKGGSRFRKKMTEEEKELQKLEKHNEKIRKWQDKKDKKRAKEDSKRLKLDKNKKLLASWENQKKSDISLVKSVKPYGGMATVVESPYFGHPMEEIAPWGGVPFFITKSIEYLECTDLTIEGLYRKEGNKRVIGEYERTFDLAYKNNGLSKFIVEDLDVSVHVVTSSIKNFFKRLPTPLIPKEFQDLLLAAVEIDKLSEESVVGFSINKVLEIVNCFTRNNKETFKYTIRHLSRINELKDHNKMSANNLAVIFWPTIMQPETEVLATITEREKFSKMLEFIIAHCDELFGPELPDTLPPEDDDIYDSIFHPEHSLKRTHSNRSREYDYIGRPKTYFNQPLRPGARVPSLVKQCIQFLDKGPITSTLYINNAREDLVQDFITAYETAYCEDEHRTVNIQALLHTSLKSDDSMSGSIKDSISGSITGSTKDSIGGSITSSVDPFGSVSSGNFTGSTSERPSDTGDCITTATDVTSGVDTADSPEEMCSVFDEDTKDSSIIATVLKRYLAGLSVALIPDTNHAAFLNLLDMEEGEDKRRGLKQAVQSLEISHQLLLSFLSKHLLRAHEKGVEQISETFYPVLFLADTITTEDSRHISTMQYIITNHEVFNTKPQIPIYAAIGRSDTHDSAMFASKILEHSPTSQSPYCITSPNHFYHLPSLPEEARIYDMPPDACDPLYSNISKHEVEYDLPPDTNSDTEMYSHEPAYADPDDLLELYDDDQAMSLPLPLPSLPDRTFEEPCYAVPHKKHS